MLNINQNFDLKAPVFNFDRDYFNSVEELEAYDTSNVPDHFVTNVAGMLYQFTDGKWLPMIGTEQDDPENPEDHVHYVNLIDSNCYVCRDPDKNEYTFRAMGENTNLAMSSEPSIYLSTDVDDATYPTINLTQRTNEIYKYLQIGMTDDGSFGLDMRNKTAGNIQILTDAILTDEEIEDGNSLVNMSLSEGDYKATVNAKRGFTHKAADGYKATLDSEGMRADVASNIKSIYARYAATSIEYYDADDCYFAINNDNGTDNTSYAYITLGSDGNFEISRPTNTEGGVISGIKSLTAFTNPSATKVWATDGSTVDLSTKANASDVLLKKSASGGYYIESNSNKLGQKAFAANNLCNASSGGAFAEGVSNATAYYAHSEGYYTNATGFASHTQGSYNIINQNAIHSVGIGVNVSNKKNAEYIYVKNNTNNTALVDDPKNGYKYLIGVGGYDGISIDNTTYKSVQEVIADLTARIEQLETKVKALEAANAPA